MNILLFVIFGVSVWVAFNLWLVADNIMKNILIDDKNAEKFAQIRLWQMRDKIGWLAVMSIILVLLVGVLLIVLW